MPLAELTQDIKHTVHDTKCGLMQINDQEYSSYLTPTGERYIVKHKDGRDIKIFLKY